MSKSWRVEGLRELQDKLIELKQLGGQPNRTLVRAGRVAWKNTLAEAKHLCPVLDPSSEAIKYRTPGLLRDSITITVKKPKKGDVVLTVGLKIKKLPKGTSKKGVDNPRRRWHFVEFGTSKMARKSFIRPSFDTTHTRIVETFRVELGKAIDRAMARRSKAAAGGSP